MASGALGTGLAVAGAGASIAGQLLKTGQDSLDRRISEGAEDPLVAEMRRRLAAQNAQTAMSVAASQQGVNPALAHRQAQAALSQTQTRTNAQLASVGARTGLEARGATRAKQKNATGGVLNSVATGLNALGALQSADAASQSLEPAPEVAPAPHVASGAQGLTAPPPQPRLSLESSPGAVPGVLSRQGAAGLSAPPRPVAQTAAGLSAPPRPVAQTAAEPAVDTRFRGDIDQAMAPLQALTAVPRPVTARPLSQVQQTQSSAPTERGAEPIAPLAGTLGGLGRISPQVVPVEPVRERALAVASPAPALTVRDSLRNRLLGARLDGQQEAESNMADILERDGLVTQADGIRASLARRLGL